MLAKHAEDPASGGRGRVLSGYNHNFTYRGRIFHVQTEDYGLVKAYICTHLFIDGAVVASSKEAYGDEQKKPENTEAIRELMVQAHRAMFVRLKQGEFDEMADQGPAANTPVPEERPFGEADWSRAAQDTVQRLCEELQGLEGLVVLDAAQRNIYTLEERSCNLGPALHAVAELTLAQFDNTAKLTPKDPHFELVGMSATQIQILVVLHGGVVMFLVIDRAKSNLALARHQVESARQKLASELSPS